MSISKQVENLEKENERLIERVAIERSKAKDDALNSIRYKTKGFTDGTASILQTHGMDGAKSYAVADEIWDLVKGLVAK